MGIKQDLREGGIPEGQRPAFLDPCGSGPGGGNVDLVLPGGGDDVAEGTHDVFFGMHIDKAGVVFLRHQVAAVRIHAFLKNIGNLLEVGAKSLEHAFPVFVRGAAALCPGVMGRCRGRLGGKGLTYGRGSEKMRGESEKVRELAT